MPARRASTISPLAIMTTTRTPSVVYAADGGVLGGGDAEGPPRKRSKVYDEDRIGADIRAVYPDWEPVNPTLLTEHGFAGSPLSDVHVQENSFSNNTPPQDVTRLGRLDSVSSSGSPTQPPTDNKSRPSGKGRGSRGGQQTKKKNNNNKNSSRATAIFVPNLRNADHDIPGIVEGPYADFLDRHGQRPEYFPQTMLLRLEKERLKRAAPLPATPESLPSPSSEDGRSIPTTTTTTTTNNNNKNKNQVWIVTHTQQGGYDRFRPVQRGIPDSSSAGSGVRFHGVFATQEDANVKAMEVFQKLHRDFMLCNAGARGSLGFGLLGTDSLGFFEMDTTITAAAAAAASTVDPSNPFYESHPALQGTCEKTDLEGASWWVDHEGCLSLRAMNWGTGDSRIFVAKQEFCH
ncbi:hypothetical protein GGS20DRAFT_537695 [Poronia punctata]|nr:hypothetical protein GGS20DRAFT_537695 [Poronia punctata]